jgi:cyclopropane-fatty-acyl-phospholipid synthase
MDLFLRLMRKGVLVGSITVQLPDGERHTFGQGEPSVTWVIKDRGAMRRIARNWEFELGETYMDELWEVADGSLYDLLTLLRINFSIPRGNLLTRLLRAALPVQRQWNSLKHSLSNVSHHYDLDAQLFSRFLDPEMNYSCAYYTNQDMTLEAAQAAKCRHIADKLLLSPGDRVLDIGCGWGSLAMYLAAHHQVHVTGVSLSAEQLKVATERVTQRGLQDKVTLKLQDYREVKGEFNRIVSIGMFEHVGQPNFQTYFDKITDSLSADGVSLVHTIGRSRSSVPTNAWIARYIFPGGFVPSLSDICQPVERSGLMLTDVEVLRQHYAQTLAAWGARFTIHRDEIVDLKGERFCRLWDFYLSISQVVFNHADAVVFQLQFAHQHGVVPMTRDYLHQYDINQTENYLGKQSAAS